MIRVTTFGGLGVHGRDGAVVGVAAQRRSLALLALLAAAGEKGLTRDKILCYLWPDSDTERARHALAQALYALRRHLDPDVLIVTVADVRLKPECAGSDVAEFGQSIERRDFERAVALYTGPFLDGFSVSNAPDFERWMEAERSRFAQSFVHALETLAAEASSRADYRAAADWWRRLAASDPLNSRAAMGLMRALVDGGDRVAALRYARVYETLLREELDVAPEPEIVRLTSRLRTETDSASGMDEPWPEAPRPTVARTAHSPADSSSTSDIDPSAASQPAAETGPGSVGGTRAEQPERASRSWYRSQKAAGIALMLVVGVVAALAARAVRSRTTPAPSAGLIAVGSVTDYSGSDSSAEVRSLADMLATNLARVPNLQVVSNARIYELLGQSGLREDAAVAMARAARRAGATEIVEGSLYRRPGGGLRFDLRRVNAASGAVRAAYTVEGADAYALVDRATAQLAAGFDVRAETLHVADVTTRSLAAYRLYEQGLRANYQRNDVVSAHRLFGAAVEEDSTFALAAFHAFLTGIALSVPDAEAFGQRAVRMAGRASDRERLLILSTWNQNYDEPVTLPLAETLAVRFPADPDGHYALGVVLWKAGDFAAALLRFRRVIAIDTTSLLGDAVRCRACDALEQIIGTYVYADSLAAAKRTARDYVRLRPRSAAAWNSLALVLEREGNAAEARTASATAEELSPISPSSSGLRRAATALRAGEFAAAERILRPLAGEGSAVRGEALWWEWIGRRNEGRLREALAVARQYRLLARRGDTSAAGAVSGAMLEAQVLFELGRNAEAASLFDSLLPYPGYPPDRPAKRARHAIWMLTHTAAALAAAGDTTRLRGVVDTLQMLGPRSVYGRDQRLHHDARGLLLVAQQRPTEAESEFRRAMYSPTSGYTRTNLQLGRLLLSASRPADAIAALQPALRGPLDASNLYVTRTELHELLAQAFDAVGQPDSAVAHYRQVTDAWRGADSQFRQRRALARERLGALTAGR